MDENESISAWERFWPWAVLLLITFGSLSFMASFGANVIYYAYPSYSGYLQVIVVDACWIVSLVISAWIIYRWKMAEGDQSPIITAAGSATFVVGGVALEVFIVYLIQSALPRHHA
jgi:hypothetical protein